MNIFVFSAHWYKNGTQKVNKQILSKLFFGIVEFCQVDNKKLLLVGGLGVGAYIVYKGLQLRQAAKDIQVYIQGVDFDIFKTQKNIRVIPTMVIVNPIATSIKISNIYGNLTDDQGTVFGYFQTGPVTVQSGSVSVKIPIIVNGLNSFLTVIDAVTNNKWPKFTINYTISLAGGIIPIKSRITFDTSVVKKAINYF
jgi:hypothetical protein